MFGFLTLFDSGFGGRPKKLRGWEISEGGRLHAMSQPNADKDGKCNQNHNDELFGAK